MFYDQHRIGQLTYFMFPLKIIVQLSEFHSNDNKITFLCHF